MSAKSSCTKYFKRCGTLKRIAKIKRTVRLAIALEGFIPKQARPQVPRAFTTNKTKTSLSSCNLRTLSSRKAWQVQIVSNSAMAKISTLKILSCFSNFKGLKIKWYAQFLRHTTSLKPKVTSGICCGHHALASPISMKDSTNTRRSTNSLIPKKSQRKIGFALISSACKKNLAKQHLTWRQIPTSCQKSSGIFTTTIKSLSSMNQKRTSGS